MGMIAMKRLISTILFAVTFCSAASLVGPISPFPGGRMSMGLAYNLEGMSITNRNIPAVMNGFTGNLSYSPAQYVNIGIEAGATSLEVASDSISTDSGTTMYKGKYKFSGGAALHLSSPLAREVFGITGIAKADYFSSDDGAGASYKGFSGIGVLGLVFHIKGFGYIATGPRLYFIEGQDKGYNQSNYSDFHNTNNLQAWLAMEWFPKTSGGSIPYFGVELTAGPKVNFGGRAPVNEFSVSATIGAVSKRLSGEASELEWHP